MSSKNYDSPKHDSKQILFSDTDPSLTMRRAAKREWQREHSTENSTENST
jgi:hypothetical protein